MPVVLVLYFVAFRTQKAIRLAEFMRITDAATVVQKYVRSWNASFIYDAIAIQYQAIGA